MIIRNVHEHNKEYRSNPEYKANTSTVLGMTVGVLMVGVIWLFNMLHIFIVDKKIVSMMLVHALGAYAVGMLLTVLGDLTSRWLKYVLLAIIVFMATMTCTFMTYHATLTIVFPIVCASMYSSKKVMWYTYILTVLGIIISIFGGYWYGVCDANMVLLTNTRLSNYLTEMNTFGKSDVNADILRTLTLYYVIPRSMCLGVIAFACNVIGNMLQDNISFAHEMKHMAELDEMTGAYNKSKYLSAIEKDYQEEEQVAVVFWDINNLKEMNDSQGHECGDKLICMMANSINYVADKAQDLYRIGGDEFVLIMRGSDEEQVLDLLKRWRLMIDRLNAQANMEVSASYGYACGQGSCIHQVIQEADQMMYEHKRKYHGIEE